MKRYLPMDQFRVQWSKMHKGWALYLVHNNGDWERISIIY